MANVTCSAEDFYDNFMAMCEQFVDECEQQLVEDVYSAADDACAELKQAKGPWSHGNEPEEWARRHPDRPQYAYEKGWVAYKHKLKDGHVQAVVANKAAPGLTHLIEKGHELFIFGRDTGRRTKARPHIREAYEHSRDKNFGRY